MTAILYKRITAESICLFLQQTTGESMVDGYLGKLTTEHRMLIHLYDNILPNNQWEAPAALTQAGISAAVHVQRKHVPRTLKRLEKADEITIHNRHVPGAKQRRKVYSLTAKGRARAKLLVEQTLSTQVIYQQGSKTIREIPKKAVAYWRYYLILMMISYTMQSLSSRQLRRQLVKHLSTRNPARNW